MHPRPFCLGMFLHRLFDLWILYLNQFVFTTNFVLTTRWTKAGMSPPPPARYAPACNILSTYILLTVDIVLRVSTFGTINDRTSWVGRDKRISTVSHQQSQWINFPIVGCVVNWSENTTKQWKCCHNTCRCGCQVLIYRCMLNQQDRFSMAVWCGRVRCVFLICSVHLRDS